MPETSRSSQNTALRLALVGAAGCFVLVAGGIAWQMLRLPATSKLERAHAALSRHDWAELEATTQALLATNSNIPEARRMLARAQLEQSRLPEAWSNYGKCAAAGLPPDDLNALADSLEAKGNHLLASLLRSTANASNPAASSTGTPQDADADELRARLASLDSESTRLHLLLSMIDPNDPAGGAPARLADALARSFNQVPLAFAAQTSPQLLAKLIARALLGTGRYAQALETLDALEPASLDPETHWLRSRALLGVGRPTDAAGALTQAADFAGSLEIDADPAPYVGAERCAACHQSHARTQTQSRHALTFLHGEQLQRVPLPDRPVPDPMEASVTHQLMWEDQQLLYKTQTPSHDTTARVLYGFGSGKHGVTLVGMDAQNRPVELRLSHYAGAGWDRTTGHPVHPAQSAEYLGRILTWKDVDSCLSCHTTEPRAARRHEAPAGLDRGIGCERCHGPGGNHVLAVEAKFPSMAIAMPAGARAAEVTRLCGQCHKPRETALANPAATAAAARFQAATFPLSRCYDPAGTTLTCVTCHDPHRDSQPSTEFYTVKCHACHNSAESNPQASARACPVSPDKNCVACHMPKVESTSANTLFTDHHIRVHAN